MRKKNTPSVPPTSTCHSHSALPDTKPTREGCKPLISVRESIRKPYLDPESTLSTIITSTMPAYLPCPTCMVSMSTSHHQSMTTYHHNVVCMHPPRPDGSAMSVDPNRWNTLSKEYNLSVAPMSNPGTWSSLQSLPPLVHMKSPYSCVPLPLLSQFHVATNPLLRRGTTECIDYDVCMHPLTAKKLHAFGSDSQWQAKVATNPGLASLMIRLALVEWPIVIFPTNVGHGIVTINDVLLAVHYAVCMSITKDNHRWHKQDAELWLVDNSAVRSDENRTCRRTSRIELEGHYKWVGLTLSPTEHDIWILLMR